LSKDLVILSLSKDLVILSLSKDDNLAKSSHATRDPEPRRRVTANRKPMSVWHDRRSFDELRIDERGARLSFDELRMTWYFRRGAVALALTI